MSTRQNCLEEPSAKLIHIGKEKTIGALFYINLHRGKLYWFRINTKVDKQMKKIKAVLARKLRLLIKISIVYLIR